MPPTESLTDDVVASLLAKDAKASNSKYATYGLQGLLPKRPTYNAPKPNTRFLKNIIKETDSHNAALRAKEVADSRARLRKLHDTETRQSDTKESYGRLSREEDPPPKRRRIDKEDEYKASSRGDRGERPERDYTRRSRAPHSHRGHRDRSNESDKDEPKRSHRSHRQHHRKSHRRRSRSRTRSQDDERESRRRRHRSGSPRDSRSHSPRPRKPHRRRSRPRSRSDSPRPQQNKRRNPTDSILNGHIKKKKAPTDHLTTKPTLPLNSPSPSDSDPLDSIIGPPPPPAQPLPRGRGATTTLTTTSTIDAHFSSTYDPTTDIQPPSPSSRNPLLTSLENDDWDLALEALRDRQKWQRRGAERLKAAGFSEEEVGKWEKGGFGVGKGGSVGGGGGEGREEGVRWRGRGEGREWDRGKIVGEEGVVETGAEWGRLKGT